MRKFILALLLVLPIDAVASPVILSGSWGTSTAFWNNTSYDRNGQANIGNWIMGSGASDVPNFYSNSPNIGATWLGDGTGTFLFDLTDPTLLTHWFSVTGWDDEYGIYQASDGYRIPLGTAWQQQYADTGRSIALFTPGIWGLYLVSGEGNTWYSGQITDGRSHFALFQGQDSWYVGIEDATWNTPRTADWDYNDVILEVTPMPVPEPVSLGTFGLGLLAIAALKRRLR